MSPLRALLADTLLLVRSATAQTPFRAGAAPHDISPAKFPTPVKGSRKAGFAQGTTDLLRTLLTTLKEGK